MPGPPGLSERPDCVGPRTHRGDNPEKQRLGGSAVLRLGPFSGEGEVGVGSLTVVRHLLGPPCLTRSARARVSLWTPDSTCSSGRLDLQASEPHGQMAKLVGIDQKRSGDGSFGSGDGGGAMVWLHHHLGQTRHRYCRSSPPHSPPPTSSMDALVTRTHQPS